MIVYSHSVTPRLQYVINFLAHYYGLPIQLTSNEQKFSETPEACKINYSYHKVAASEIWIHPHPLLSESAIRPVKAVCFPYAGHPAFFKTEGDLPFDIFAAIFYLMVRYEEYLPHKTDLYGRYAHGNALASREGFLHLPLVNIWLDHFRTVLAAKEVRFPAEGRRFSFVPTYDIDMAWSYRHKGFRRNGGALVQALVRGRWRHMVQRIRVLTNKAQDPFDCYDWLHNLHLKHALKPLYFFLVADKTGRLDKNISPRNAAFQQLVRNVAAGNRVGLHPSWQSGDEQALLKNEKGYLEKVSGQKITASRQHFIRFTLPETYRRLLAAGITDDYSMGYGSINGFRASIATPYYWYDLQQEVQTPLRIHPFCFMDANAYYEQQLSAEAAAAELEHYHNITRSVNGTLYTIWHNSFLGTDAAFSGWREVYERFVQDVAR